MDTAHVDTFVRDNLPPPELQPAFRFEEPQFQYPLHLNGADLLDQAAALNPNKTAILFGAESWTYAELLARANEAAQVLQEDLDLIPGQRVLLHAPNTPMAMAVWFGILKAGGVVVATMPMLRAGELTVVIAKAAISHALYDPSTAEAVGQARAASPTLTRALDFNALSRLMADKPDTFQTLRTFRHDPALIAFTSGTTGQPKGCVQFHRDIAAIVDAFARPILKPGPDDIFCGTPPFAFTFGLGASVIFPIALGLTTALSPKPGYEALCETIQAQKVTTLFTAPTAYRALLKMLPGYDLASLKTCVSAGEPLPRATSDAWFEATGVRLIDGIGSTEMMHIFISASGEDIRPGATGRPVPGFAACVLDDQNQPLPAGSVGRLAVQGPTGCRYLADPRQANYVVNRWNVTGDLYRQDEDGYFWFVSRADDMIVSSGYNIGAIEVEQALLTHPQVAECAVVGVPDEARGAICKALIVLHDPANANEATALALQDHVKATIAPYKYPRAVAFVAELPKTPTGKLQRFRLREMAHAS